MSEDRVNRYLEVQWWPSPTHAAIMLQIARDTWKLPDPSAPNECAGMVRVRTTQAELSETLNVSPRTVRKVFNDFRMMRVMRPTDNSRTWYLARQADDAAAFTKRMQEQWANVKKALEDAEPEPWEQAPRHLPDAEAAVRGTPQDQGGTPSEEGYTPRKIDSILHPDSPPPATTRLVTAINIVADSKSLIPMEVHEWTRRTYGSTITLVDYLDRSDYDTVEEWLDAEYMPTRETNQ